MKRRSLLAGFSLLLPCGRAWSQRAARRVVVLTGGDRSSIPSALREALIERLRSGGFFENRNLILEWTYAEDSLDRLNALASQLAKSKPDLILAINTPAALAAKRATTSVPIVFVRVADPVGVGLTASLARPDANATGFMPFTPELGAKRLAILKQILPGVSRMAVLYLANNPGAALTYRQIASAGPKLGVTIRDAAVSSSAGLSSAIEKAAQDRAGALLLVDDVVMAASKATIVATALKHRLPISSIYRDFAESGALIAYGPDPDEMYSGAADYAVRILGGARPRDLPVQQPARFLLVLNLKTADTLRINVPASILSSADAVIR